MAGNLDRNLRLPRMHFWVLLHAANTRHGTNGFTSSVHLPKEGVLRIFSSWKIRRLRPGLNPRTWVPKASTLSLDQRSRLCSCVRKMLEIRTEVCLLVKELWAIVVTTVIIIATIMILIIGRFLPSGRLGCDAVQPGKSFLIFETTCFLYLNGYQVPSKY